MMASNRKPRIAHHALVTIGTEFLDRASPTNQDWRVFASYLGFTDSWIQKVESVCFPTGNSPTATVLRAWQEGFHVSEPLPVREQLIECLKQMKRKDAASHMEQMMEDGTFLDQDFKTLSPSSRFVPRSNQTCCYTCTCQTRQHTCTSQTNDCTGRSNKSAQENSYHGSCSMHGHCHSFLPQDHPEKRIDCERKKKAPTCPYEHQLTSTTYHQPHQPKNCQSVVSLSSAISDKSENLPMSSHWNNTKTWPIKTSKRGDDSNSNRGETRQQFHTMELQTLFRNQLSQDDDSCESRPFHSLVSTTSEDRHHHDAGHGRYSQEGAVDRMMIENPTRASPQNQTLQGASVLITYAYKNYKTAHRLATLLIHRKHEVTVDTTAPIESPRFNSVTYVIIIYTRDYFNEVAGIVQSRLNTRLIYDLMAKEFNHLGNRNLRFIPIFDHDRIDRETIPGFLRNYPKQPTWDICKILDGEISIQRRVYSSR